MKRGVPMWLLGVGVLCLALRVHAETEQIDLKALAKKARPAVMLLAVSDADGKEIATGTGFLVSSDGKLITNHHVIEGAASGVAKAENGGLFPVEGVLADDPKNDLVLLKVKGKDLPFLTFSTNENIEAGTRIAVIGSPLGLEGTLSEGIVSAVRDLLDDMKTLQITAAISPGSSGSPVLNAKGEVIGVARAQFIEGQALNFAVHVDAVRKLAASATDKPASLADGREKENTESAFFLSEEWEKVAAAEQADDWVQMLKATQALVRRFPDRAEAHRALGAAYSRLGFYNEATAAFRQAITLRPDDEYAWYCLAVSYENLGRYDQAIAASQQATKLKPNDLLAWHILGANNGRQGKNDEAIAAFQQAAKLKPNDQLAWYGLGVCYGKQAKRPEAFDALDHLRKLDPSLAAKLADFLSRR
jgi:Flp pilus assembly protein TadD